MACVTLKRSLDFDPLHSPTRPIKRRRCLPLTGHCSPDKRVGQEPGVSQGAKPSEFKESVLSPEQIANNLRDEMKRLKKRREFRGQCPPSPGSSPSSPEPMMDAPMEGGSSSSSSTAASVAASPSRTNAEKPIFTLKQMSMIAERMCAERVEQVRAEYDQILQQKLSEQYDAFVKFIDHQIQKRFTESMAPSYLS